MRRVAGFLVVFSAASLSCSSDEGDPANARTASGATAGQSDGGSAGSGISGSAGGGRAGEASGGAGLGGGSSGGAGRGGEPSGGTMSGGDGGKGATGGDGNAGTGVAGDGRVGGSAGTSSGGAGAGGSTGGAGAGGSTGGAGGTAPTSCDDPLAVGDTTRFTATDSLETYSIMGNTADELRASLNENRGMDYDAYTSWAIEWDYDNCSDPEWFVSLEIAYFLPEWVSPPAADPALVDRWSAYLDALYCHEYGHGELAIDCANNVMDALEQVPGTSDCGTLQETANQAFQSVIADCNAADIEYDETTNHGATMGAVFP